MSVIVKCGRTLSVLFLSVIAAYLEAGSDDDAPPRRSIDAPRPR
jgi:hypothetical protein